MLVHKHTLRMEGDRGGGAPSPAPAPGPAPSPRRARGPAPAEPAGYWPADWRKNIAGEDEKEIAQIGRYASPADIWKKARALEQRMSSGELRPVLMKDAKPEELTAYRKAHG